MPDRVKEKLLELLNEASDILLETAGGLNDNHGNGIRADHLIAHGVTVLTEDEAKNIYTAQQIEEIQNEAYDLGADSVLRHKFGLTWDNAAGLRKEIKRLQDATKWIPVAERLPEKAGDYLIYATVPFNGRNFIAVMHYDKDEYCPIWQDTSHWMHLPQPPKGE